MLTSVFERLDKEILQFTDSHYAYRSALRKTVASAHMTLLECEHNESAARQLTCTEAKVLLLCSAVRITRIATRITDRGSAF